MCWAGGALVASPKVDDRDGERDEEGAHDEDEEAEREGERDNGAEEQRVAAGVRAHDVRAELRADVEARVDEEEHL